MTVRFGLYMFQTESGRVNAGEEHSANGRIPDNIERVYKIIGVNLYEKGFY